MLDRTYLRATIGVLVCGLAAATASAQPWDYTEGHVDKALRYEHGQLRWVYMFDSGAVLDGTPVPSAGTIFETDQVVTVVPEFREIASPFDIPFLGVQVDDPIWTLPPNFVPGVPELGFDTGNLVATDWSGKMTLSLESVSGPGEFAIWQTTGPGQFVHYWSSLEPYNTPFEAFVPDHTHFSMGFTAPGYYQVELKVLGTLVGGQEISGINTFTFRVEPVPFLPGDANLDGVVDDLDLAIVQANFGQLVSGWSDGDFTGDGRVSLRDAFILSENYSPISMTMIPEPVSLAVLGLGALVLMGRSVR
ncbi:MAG: choice-of-anchor M domain-containing protein [Phycisphaeraceae bacterium]|nr:choice-of-anchor M domain-containing protein [Phycisphaeraceae bacterium]